MRHVLSLGAFIITVVCLVVFVITLRPEVIKTGHAPAEPGHRHMGRSGSQECVQTS